MLRVRIDRVGLQLISYFIENGPTTIYRAAMDLSLYFSHAYKKVVKLVDAGLLIGEKIGRSTMYDVTPKGIILCLAHRCTNTDIGIKKLLVKMGAPKLDPDTIQILFDLYAAIYEPNAPLSDIYSMAAYIIRKCGSKLIRCTNVINEEQLNLVNAAITNILTTLASTYLGEHCNGSCELEKIVQALCSANK